MTTKIYVVDKFFTRDELADRITGEMVLQEGFAEDLKELREEYNFAMNVNSGCRSQSTNDALVADPRYSASPTSLHLIDNKKYGTNTCAIDISKPDSVRLARLLRLGLLRGWSFGIAKTFIHLDMRSKYCSIAQKVFIY